jgi:hypothetical protein
VNQPTDTNDAPVMGDDDTYFIETFLRQKGDFRTLLAIDALVLRDDLAIEEKVAQLQQTIQGAFNG